MRYQAEDWTLSGDHFCINIAAPENLANGLINPNRDPRKQRKKPDVYIGKVEEVSPRCRLVKVGDTVVVERWEWQQMNLDDERLVARERDLLVLDSDIPAPGIMVLQLAVEKVKTELIVPDTYQAPKSMTYHGKVIATNANLGYGEVGEEVYVEASDYGQFRDGQGRLYFRTGKYANVLLRLKREPVLEVI